jgi:uncharacterized membrane protein
MVGFFYGMVFLFMISNTLIEIWRVCVIISIVSVYRYELANTQRDCRLSKEGNKQFVCFL